MKKEINCAQRAEKESNEAFVERMIKEFDTWQNGRKKERVALVVLQDETGKTTIECFGDNRGKNPLMRFIGRMIGIVAHRDRLYEVVIMVAKFASKIRNREGGK